MKVMLAKDASYIHLESFFEKNGSLDRQLVYQEGYVVEIGGAIEGCFLLQQVEEGTLWLKQLYITQAEAMKLPVLLETILTMAKELEAKSVYVKSHQPVVDILLEALQFNRREKVDFQARQSDSAGKWWTYSVS